MNVIDISLSCKEHDVEVNLYHNQTLIQKLTANQGSVRINIDATNISNTLTIAHKSKYNVVVDSISMFEMGHSKLKYLGIYTSKDNRSWSSHIIEPDGTWKLTYQYPVFSWLHKTLNLGWLINPDVL